MAISRVASQDITNSASAATITATYPTIPTNNNLLVAVVATGGTTNVPTITGWTAAITNTTGSSTQKVTIFYRQAGISETTSIVANCTSALVMRIAIYEYSGLRYTITPFDLTASGGSAGTTLSVSCGTTASLGQDDELIIAAAYWTVTQTLSNWSNSFNARSSVVSNMFTADRISTAGGTYTTTITVTGTSATVSAAIATFRGAPTFSNNYQFVKAPDGISVSEKIR